MACKYLQKYANIKEAKMAKTYTTTHFPIELVSECIVSLNRGKATIYRNNKTGKVDKRFICTDEYPGKLNTIQGWYYDKKSGHIRCVEGKNFIVVCKKDGTHWV